MTAIPGKPRLLPRGGHAVAAALGGLLAIAAGIGVGRFVYTPILPPMVAELGLSRSAAGLIASANFLGYLIGALAAALPSLPGSRRAWVLGALSASVVTTAAMGIADTFPEFVGLRLVGGIASAFVLIIGSTLVLEHLADMRRSALSALHFAGVGSGIAVSAALVAGLLALGQSWRVLWLASGALACVALGAVAALLPRGATPAGDGGPSRAGAPPSPELRRLTVAYGLYGFGYVITATFIVAIVRATPAIRALEPAIWIVVGLSAAPSIGIWTRTAARTGLPVAFALACVIEAGGVVASVAWPTATGIFVAAVLLGGTFMGLTALGLIWARRLATGDPRRALAMVTGAFGLGQIIGPAFAGIVSDHLGSFLVPSIAAAAALLIAAGLAIKDGDGAAGRPG
ncbi:MAG TPA: YbfB/YjiJ family MFS transporter [Stellaceae bacterium]|nr:YbfB/YjiJ family MFS transporter [Stellaceae bacterium]